VEQLTKDLHKVPDKSQFTRSLITSSSNTASTITIMLEGEGCGDPCGWIAAIIGALAYGSYGVPIKATLDIEVHPLVLQSYKTVVLFTLSWFVLLLGEEAKWSGYGIISGFLWVSGGSFGILAIRNAGMAVAVGTWASVMVLVNFVWGILVFQEPVNSFSHTCMAFGTLSCGLVGMSKYSVVCSKPSPSSQDNPEEVELPMVESRFFIEKDNLTSRRRLDEEEVTPMLPATSGDRDEEKPGAEKKLVHTVIAGIPLTQRESGILFAVLNGLLAGSSLVPMHFAKAHGFMGRSYILSFGSGSMAANLVIWAGYFVFVYLKNRSEESTLRTTYHLMPALHLKALWFRGVMAGLLLTIGMFGAIFAIAFLGQGIGNSLIQSKILISGLWGIFWFKEVKDPEAIGKWFASATVCVASILWLSYERNLVTSKG
jgi:glucose uptake protein GlcU